MTLISKRLRRVVVERAENRCEYCKLAQVGQEAAFHIDHVVPFAAGGLTEPDNLALACVSCSLRKWATQTAIDPETDRQVPLFNPRMHVWTEHFRWESAMLVALTPVGRATIQTLALNRPMIVSIRLEERECGRFPP